MAMVMAALSTLEIVALDRFIDFLRKLGNFKPFILLREQEEVACAVTLTMDTILKVLRPYYQTAILSSRPLVAIAGKTAA